MAEARSIADALPPLSLYAEIDPTVRKIQARLSNDGMSFFIPHPRYLLRSALRSIRRIRNKMQQVFVPVPLSIVVFLSAGTLFWTLSSKSTEWARNCRLSHIVWRLDSALPWTKYIHNEIRVAYLAIDVSLGVIGGFTFFHRMFLRLLLSYTGWMDEGRGKKSWKTTIWGFLLKYVYMRDKNRLMLSHQTSLPAQPIPSVKDTVDRYLISMEPLLDEAQHAELRASAEIFVKHESAPLQRYLTYQRWTSTNWIAKWWIDYVYLASRKSLMINSNYYGLSTRSPLPTTNQAARAANMIYHLVHEKLEIDHEVFPAMAAQGIVPVCMDQYTRAFALNREPGATMDKLVKYDSTDSRHVVVLCRGHYFKLKVFCDLTGRQLSRLQLECAIKRILEATPQEETPEAKIGALTAHARDEWSKVREQYFLRDNVNRASLEIIERSLFFVTLEDYGFSPYDLTENARQYMTGRGYDRWFDKSFQAHISSTGYCGINGEHAWGDAPALAHLVEIFMGRENKEAKQVYSANDGSIIPTPQEQHWLDRGTLRVYHGERLLFNVGRELRERVQEACVASQAAIDDLDLIVEEFTTFGKAQIKKAGCSPDGFLQMALQLAWYRQFGSLTQTYESAMMRFYQNGRTETIRSATNHALKFVESMRDDSTISREDRIGRLRGATENHARLSCLAMTGRGVDRHLFGLMVVAHGMQKKSAFLDFAIGFPWKLSTSQIPALQTPGDWPTKDNVERFARPAGGFGPVADDGYGVCYTLAGDRSFFFHVSSKKSCPKTSSRRMQDEIAKALKDMIALWPEIQMPGPTDYRM